MDRQYFSELEKAISVSRLSTYRSLIEATSDTKLIQYYIYNAKISENFYFLLQNLEVTLRNAIYDSYSHARFSRNFFYLREQDTRQRYNREFHSYACWKMIGTVKYHLQRDGISPTDGKIISELNFGFWTTLLEENHYKSLIWRQIFRQVFPYFPHGRSVDNDVDIVSATINNIRKFRNRIFHYEPILNRHSIKQDRDEILKVIGWISPEMKKLTELFDETDMISNHKRKIAKSLKRLSMQNRVILKKRKKNKPKRRK